MARILVIEDEKMARYTVHQILDRAGHEIEEAENGAIGLDRLEAAAFDLVITDIFMPVMEGIETIQEIKRRHPDQKILAMSGGGRTQEIGVLRAAQAFGAVQHIAKPFSEDEMLVMVEASLAG